jgi:DNA polymerase
MITAAEGYDLIACDLSQIEARVVAWLAGEEKVLRVFARGDDVYVHAAMDIYGIPDPKAVTPEQRAVGKVAILALGFGGGVGAFQMMARAYSVTIGDEQAETVKKAWRAKNTRIVQYWYDLEDAAMNAVLHPGQVYSAGAEKRKVHYVMKGSCLWCRLPSGRLISYPFAEIREVKTPWGAMKDAVTYMAEDSQSHQWERHTAYGGLLCENITQAVARDVLAAALIRVEAAGYPVVFHVHDELATEMKEGLGSVKELTKIVCEVPIWAHGLPVAAEGWRGKRYRK